MDKKKILLAYCPSEQQFLPVPPLGISVLSEYLKEQKIENDIIDLELELWLQQGMKSSEYASYDTADLVSSDLLLDGLAEQLVDYEIIAFSVMGKRQIPYLLGLVKKLRCISEKLQKVIVGGAFFNEVSVKNLIISEKNIIDFAIVGEGWLPIYELISNIVMEKPKSKIKGVAYIDENEDYIYSDAQGWNDSLPMPNYAGINKKGYITQQEKLYGIKDESITYQVLVGDRNCPYSCSFCRISKTTRKVKTPIEIAKEMVALNRLYGADRFSLVCNEMNPNLKYLNDYLDTLLGANENLKWFCYLRPNDLSNETLTKVRKAGCTMIRYGAETGSQKILDGMNKKLYVDEIEQIMKGTHEAGIWNHINIVTGYLYENENDVQLTLDFLERNKDYIDSVRVNPFYLPINSPIHKNPEKYGIKIIENTGSYLKFKEKDCSWEEKQLRIQNSTGRILEKCIDLEIGFAGILPFLVSTAVAHFDNVKLAKEWLKKEHSYLWRPISPDTAKWRLAHPDRVEVNINRWEEIAGKRGTNYQTLMELNND